MKTKNRIFIIDILRGFALLMIVLIHSIEHFELFRQPEVRFLFSQEFDHSVMHTAFLLISGKAYSIFALLFGLSFFIQMNNNKERGIDYTTVFIWRMFILLVIGFLHSLIYRGDILHIYALLSFPIIFLYRVHTKIAITTAILLALQIPFIYEIIRSFIDPNYEYIQKFFIPFNEANSISVTGSLSEVVSFNVWQGRKVAWLWTYYNGRYLQLMALFIAGMLLGRKHIFKTIETHRKAFVWVLMISSLTFLILKYINITIQSSELSKTQKMLFDKLLISYANLAITFLIISSLILIYLRFRKGYLFKLFAAYGKMSLTNYISQAVFGVVFFYGFGLEMYKYLGSTWSLLLGISLFFTQAVLSHHWNTRYYYGPIEWIWRCLTDLNFKIPFKRIQKQENNN